MPAAAACDALPRQDDAGTHAAPGPGDRGGSRGPGRGADRIARTAAAHKPVRRGPGGAARGGGRAGGTASGGRPVRDLPGGALSRWSRSDYARFAQNARLATNPSELFAQTAPAGDNEPGISAGGV